MRYNEPGPVDAVGAFLIAVVYILLAGILAQLPALSPLIIFFPLGFALFSFVYAAARSFYLPSVFPLVRPTLKQVAGATLMIVGILCVITFLMITVQTIFPSFSPDAIDAEEVLSKGLLSGIIGVALLPAVSEEILCRGLMLKALRGSVPRLVAIVVSNLLFAVLHFDIYRIPFTFVSGLVITWVAYETASLVLPVIMHFLHNMILFVIAWSIDRYVKPEAMAQEGLETLAASDPRLLWFSLLVWLFFLGGIATFCIVWGGRMIRSFKAA